MLASRPSHVPSECVEGIHDLGNRVDAYVEQFADKLDIRGDNILVRDIGQTSTSSESMRVLALDVPHVLDEDTLFRPKPLKADLGEHVNAQVVEGKRGSSKPVDALHKFTT